MNKTLNNFLMETFRWMRLTKKQAARPFNPGPCGAACPETSLSLRVIRKTGEVEDKGIVSTKVVTTAFVNYIVDGLQASSTDVSLFKWHDSGTGSVAEAVGDTALGTPVEARVSGTQTEGGSTNVYRTVGTITYTATRAITEHGVFTTSAGGTLMDRSVFTAINVTNGDKIEFTYDLTLPAGG